MKFLGRAPHKESEGAVKLVAEEAEDLWHAFNLIREGDTVTATTFRKIQRDLGAGSESEKVKLRLSVEVETVDFDPDGETIRLSGRNLTENEHVKLGAYHTLEVELHRPFQIHKALWDALDLARIREACDPAASADLAAVLITEGLANVCLVGRAVTLVRAKVEANLPRKRGAAAAGYDKAINRFYEKVLQAVMKNVDWEVVKCLVIAGPGFAKDEFRKYLEAEAVRQNLRPLIMNKARLVVAPATTAYKHSLKEVFSAPGIIGQIKDTKAAREVQILADFYAMMGSDSARAFYGPAHVLAAHELGAVQTLLLTDTLLRVNDVALRRRYARLVEEVGAGGGQAVVFSGMHVSGEQLQQLTGIAAILRFPLPDIEDADIEDGQLA